MQPIFVHHHGPEPIFLALVIAFVLFVIFVAAAIKLLIFCRIFAKAGYSWALGLLMIVPIADIIMAFFLAFADWPIHKELCLLKQRQEKPQV